MLPRQPGSRESRYTHLLGDPASREAASASIIPSAPSSHLADLEAEIATLRAEVLALAQRVAELEGQTHGT
jgi:uncharacterized protein YceH (UPF0502 family)